MGVGGFIPLPEADEGEGGRDFFIGIQILPPLQRDRLPQLMGDSQAVQRSGIQSGLVRCLRHPACGGCGEGVGRIAVVRPADFHGRSGKGGIFCKAENDAFSGSRHIRMGCDPCCLLLSKTADGSLRIASGLPEGHFNHVPVQALGQGEQGGKHQSGQDDGENGRQIPASVIPKGAASQHPDRRQFFFLRNGFHATSFLRRQGRHSNHERTAKPFLGTNPQVRAGLFSAAIGGILIVEERRSRSLARTCWFVQACVSSPGFPQCVRPRCG